MKVRLSRVVGCATALFLSLGVDSAAQVVLVPSGSQFQVNGFTTGAQFDPDVDIQPDGSYVVVWGGAGSSGSDSSGDSIHAQRYEASGLRVGAELQVNDFTTTSQGAPSVAAFPSGEFLVTWESYAAPGITGLQRNIRARRFTSTGTALDTEFQVNQITGGYQRKPAAAIGPAGDFVVVWQANRSAGADASGYSVQLRRYDSSGNAAAQAQVNQFTTGLQQVPSVSFLNSGWMVVVWESDGSAGGDSSYTSIQGRVFDATGTAQGTEFQVNTYTTERQHRPSVAPGPGDEFVVAWEKASSLGASVGGYSIQAQRFEASGGKLGAEIQVSESTSAHQRNASVRVGATGDFVVAWTSDVPVGSRAPGVRIRARLFASNGAPAASELQVNSFSEGYQLHPAVAAGPGGRFVAAWESGGSPESDVLLESIQAQSMVLATLTPTPTASRTATPATPSGSHTPTAVPSSSPSSTPTPTRTPTLGSPTPTGSPLLVGHATGESRSALFLLLLLGAPLALSVPRHRTKTQP